MSNKHDADVLRDSKRSLRAAGQPDDTGRWPVVADDHEKRIRSLEKCVGQQAAAARTNGVWIKTGAAFAVAAVLAAASSFLLLRSQSQETATRVEVIERDRATERTERVTSWRSVHEDMSALMSKIEVLAAGLEGEADSRRELSEDIRDLQRRLPGRSRHRDEE